MFSEELASLGGPVSQIPSDTGIYSHQPHIFYQRSRSRLLTILFGWLEGVEVRRLDMFHLRICSRGVVERIVERY